MIEFKELIGKIVKSLFLIIWPPWGENNESEIDISFGFVFEGDLNELCVVSVDKDELWSPKIWIELPPEVNYSWKDFYPRIKKWMIDEDKNLIIGKEYFNVANSVLFSKILGEEIKGIELLILENNPEPFGIKILFKDDYIISIPNSYGNTVETKAFNKNNCIENFKHLRNIKYLKL